MRLEEKLKQYGSEEIWEEYCGFLDMSVSDFMAVQNRLMIEQIDLWSVSSLGKKILGGKTPKSIEEFRRDVPLTTYEDYADVLLCKDQSQLPGEAVLWIETTWEGGNNPIKTAPYTKSMLDTYQNNMVACLLLSTSEGRGKFSVNPKDTILYGLAPLPYATGLFPALLNDEIGISFLPPVKKATSMSFRERNIEGFSLGMKRGIDFFFGVGSVTYYISLSLGAMMQSRRKKGTETSHDAPLAKVKDTAFMVARYLHGVHKAKSENREVMPKDFFKLKGFMCAGTDNRCYKDELEALWGVRPMEIFAGTEPTCIGTEIWSRDGLYLFPDACFYEFIPAHEGAKNRENPSYEPRTCLFDEVAEGEEYELVISVLKGGAFARYRVGDIYRCVGIGSNSDGTRLPRFVYVDRVCDIIDIAGFTRITKKSIDHVLNLAGLGIKDWVAAKEFNENNKPYLHMYIEMEPEHLIRQAATKEVLKEHLGIYFKYVDNDYKDLKKILGMDPLEITILPCGTFACYDHGHDKPLEKINPSHYEIRDLLQHGGNNNQL